MGQGHVAFAHFLAAFLSCDSDNIRCGMFASLAFTVWSPSVLQKHRICEGQIILLRLRMLDAYRVPLNRGLRLHLYENVTWRTSIRHCHDRHVRPVLLNYFLVALTARIYIENALAAVAP